jgi:hypothetical protein
MKSTAFLTLLATLFCVTFAVAQVPQSINYQAVIRTDSGLVVPNKSVNIRLSIQDGFTTPAIYSELHTITTNQFGLVTLSIGKGAATTGVFAQINWGIGEKFLKTEVDVNRTSNYSVIGVQQFLSVPYALYAERAGNVSATNDGWKVAGNAATAGQFLGTTNAQDLKIFTNNLQRAIFSTTGNTGIGVSLPTAIFHTVGTVRHEGLATNNAASQIIVADASGNLALRDVSTLPTGGGGGSGWLLTGNTATAANFIGTNNSQDLRFYTEGSQKMVLKTTGNLGIGTNAPDYKFVIEQPDGVTGGVDDGRTLMQLHNKSSASYATTNLRIKTGNTQNVTMISHYGPTYTLYPGFADYGLMLSTGAGLMMQAPGGNIRFMTGPAPNSVGIYDRMTVDINGNVGIATTTPTARFHSVGTARLEGLATNNSANQIIVADASGNLGLRDVSTLPTGGGGGSGWLLTGNTATAANFIGTNNSQDLRFNTEGTQKMVVKTTGYVGIGTNTPDSRFAIEGTSGLTGADDRVFMSVNNKSTSFDAQVSMRFTAGGSPDGTYLGHVSPTYSAIAGYGNFGQLASNGSGLIMQAANGVLRFQTGIAPPSIGVYDRMTILNNGNVGIGTRTPDARLVLESDGDGSGVTDDRFLLKVNNKSVSTASQSIVQITAGNGTNFMNISQSSPTYSISEKADASIVYASGTGGLVLQASPKNSSDVDVSGIHFYTGWVSVPGGSIERMTLDKRGYLGLGTITPKAKLEVTNGDVYVNDNTKGIILKSPNGGCWRVTVDNTGNFVRTSITCPN